MTANEFAFLALGLVLGLASGAALIEVLRARPPASREVRVTVAPNAIHARFAATLADPLAATVPAGPAPGGPGDRRWRDEPPHDDALAPGRRAEDHEPGPASINPVEPSIGVDSGTETGTIVPITTGRPARPAPLWLTPAAGSATALVPVPMSIEPDPLTTALRATAAAVATAAMAGSLARVAVAQAASTAAEASPASPASPASDTARGSSAAPSDASPPSAGAGQPASAPPETGPCAEERRVAEERCAVATRARAGAGAAAEALRAAQRTHDEHVAAADAAAAAADPRAVRAAKESAQQRFRDARAAAANRDDVEGAARQWLAEINEINHATREAASRIERSRASANALALTLERLAVEADAARISAAHADEACIAARDAVAACDEARALEAAAARASAPVAEPPRPAEAGRIAAATPIPEEEFGLAAPMGSRAGQDALILRILRGDREAMQHAVAQLAGQESDGGRRWQARLSGLAEALIARSIEASAFEFPVDHFFWGPLSETQNRDIAAGLSSLGFRFDGFGGWVDDRVPSQRDLSLAVGYAGLDPMRVRHWPNEAEMRELLADVRVAADEYVAGAAGGMTLGELVTLLGRRADGLTDLWNDWGKVRPVLLEGG